LKQKSTMPSEKSKLKQRSVWENKKRLVKKRLMDLTFGCTDNNEESIISETPIQRHPLEESPTNDVNCSVAVLNSPMERAEEVRSKLSPQFPIFVKPMLKSHVSGGFWLGLPKKFCLAHLPNDDETVVLVDENEEEYDTKYLVDKNGLSGGWRGFSLAHHLLDGDVLVFQLIEPCKFKVYIVRAKNLTEIDGVTSLLSLNIHAEPINKGIYFHLNLTFVLVHKCLELVHAENDQREDMEGLVYLSEAATDQAEDNSDNSSSEIMDGVKFSDNVLSFKDVKGFKDFNIHVDGLIIDAEIPTHLRTKYYKLCRSQNTFLHENLMHGLNTKLAAGMISETINIADAIRAAKPSTGTNHLQIWDRTLKAFEDLGMAVGFLRARIDKLLSLFCEVQAMIELKRTERDEAKEEMRALKMRIANLDDEIDGLVVKKEGLSSVFKEVADAPW
ncbi:AP2/B3-like transcriptional factor family protein, partial [Perilla frutescens var. hirtella]